MKPPIKLEISPNKFVDEGLLYMLWTLVRTDYSQPKGIFEFGFEYLQPFDWKHEKVMRNLFPLSEQFGITLQNPRFEKGYFEDSFEADYKAIKELTEQQTANGIFDNEISEKFFMSKERLAVRNKVLKDEPLTLDDVKTLSLDFMPLDIQNSLLEGIWFEVRPDKKSKNKIATFLDTYLTNFIDNKLVGHPQDHSHSLTKPQNFYTFEKHRSESKYKLRSMQEKYGNRFVVTGPLNKDPEFLYIHFLLASEKLGHIKIHRLSTNSGAYTHGDDPQWEAVITLQPDFDTPNSSLKKVNTGPSLGSKKREWVEFFKKMDVVIEGENLIEELNNEGDGYGQTTWSLLERTDMIMAEAPAELKKLNWVFEEYNSTPYSLEKSKAIITASLNKLSEKYETIPLVYTTLPFPSYMNFTSAVWREIMSINSFEKQDYGHIDFLNALASLAAEKTIGILFFETLAIDSKTLVFKATIIGYKPTPILDKQPEVKSEKSSKSQRGPLPITGEIKITGLQEGLQAIVGMKKEVKNKFPYKLPAGTQWENFTIKFEDDENVFIKVRQLKHHTSFKEMGFVGRGANPNPSEAWTFLKVMAQVNGELTIKDAGARDKYKKQKELLAKSLQSYFSLDYDPFYPYRSSSEKNGDSYKIKITLIPPSAGPEKKPVRKDNDDKLGVKEYLAEQAPEVYDE